MDSAQNADFYRFSQNWLTYTIQNARRFLSAQLLTETFLDVPEVLQNTRIVNSPSQTTQLQDLLRFNRPGIKA